MRIRGEELILPDRRHMAGSIGFVVACVAAVGLSWVLADPVEASAPPLSNQIPPGYVPISALLAASNASATANNSGPANCPTGEVLINSAGACGSSTNSTVTQSLPNTSTTPTVPVTAPTVVATSTNGTRALRHPRVHTPKTHPHRRTTTSTTVAS